MKFVTLGYLDFCTNDFLDRVGKTFSGITTVCQNSYGCMSDWSVQLTEALLSIFDTVQLWKINSRIWLSNYLEACADNHGKAPEKSNDFLPWQMSQELIETISKALSEAGLAGL